MKATLLNRSLGAAASMSAYLVLAAAANGEIIKSYNASSQAVAPAPNSADGGTWVAGGVSPANVTEGPGQEAGVNYWGILDDNTTNAGATANESRAYSITTASTASLAGAFTDPAGWTMTAVVKVISTSNTPSGVTLDVRGGGRLFNLSFVNDGNSQLIGQSVQGSGTIGADTASVTAMQSITDVDLGGQYNTIQMYYDPSTGLADVFVNGSLKRTMNPGSSGATQVLWSSNTSSATSETRWRLVQFETGRAIVPEPAFGGAWLAACCLGAGLSARRRSRASA